MSGFSLSLPLIAFISISIGVAFIFFIYQSHWKCEQTDREIQCSSNRDGSQPLRRNGCLSFAKMGRVPFFFSIDFYPSLVVNKFKPALKFGRWAFIYIYRIVFVFIRLILLLDGIEYECDSVVFLIQLRFMFVLFVCHNNIFWMMRANIYMHLTHRNNAGMSIFSLFECSHPNALFTRRQTCV